MNETKSAGQTTLWDDEDESQYARNTTEDAVIAAIKELDQQSTLTGMQRATAQVCRSLARSIDLGNVKGRAIANEATQLNLLLNQLAGVDLAAGDPDAMPPETKALIDALATAPRLDTPSASYSPEL